MRRWLVVLSITAACDAPHVATAVVASPSAVPPAASAVPSEPMPVASASAPAAPLPPPSDAGPTIPEQLASAPAWIYRHLQAGAIRPDQQLTTYTLRRLGTQAMLTEATQKAPASFKGDVGPWRTVETKTFVGSVEADRAGIRLKLQHGTEMLDLSCRTGAVSAARATAARARTPGKGGCEGDRGRWVPAAVSKLDALRCGPLPKDSDPDRTDEYVFAAAPGVEFLFVNDDCVIQGGGYRAVAADSAIAPVRAAR